jgi:transglutaminase-like putative cysteine protease
MRDVIDKALKASRYPLRIVIGLMAVLGVVVSFAGLSGILAALIGAFVGLLLGEGLGRWKSVRITTISAVLGGVVLIALLLARFAVDWSLVPSLVGPSISLHLKTILTLSSLAFAGLALLRTVAVRIPSWRFVEIGVFSLFFVAAFAAHRDGSIARPLWLSDWAWRAGYDPSNVLLIIGATFGVICAGLLLLESKHRLSALTLGALPLLAVILLASVEPKDLLPEPEITDLESIQNALPGGERDTELDIPTTIGTGDDPLETEAGGQLQGPDGDGDGVADANVGEGEGDGDGGQQGDGEGEEASDGGAGEEGESETGDQPEGEGEEAAGEQEGEGGQEAGDPQEGEGEQEGGEPEEGEGEGGEPQESEGEGGTPPEDVQQADQPEMSFENNSQRGAPSVAAVVVFLDDYHTPSGYYYFRQKVMSEFGSYRFEETTREDADLDVYPTFPTRVDRVREPPPWQLRTRVRARVAMIGEHDSPFALESPVLYMPSTNSNPDRFNSVYKFESMAQEVDYAELVGREARGPKWSDALLDYYLTAPADERYAELVEEILSGLPEEARADPFTRALAIKVHLDQHMAYTLDARYPGWEDATAGFLFAEEDRYVGYCVHAAHAAVYMWRLAGVPARVGTGYLVDESARRGSSLMVMGGDAHAWPELYLEGVGWIPMDISAAEMLDEPGDPVDSDATRVLGEMVQDAEDLKEGSNQRVPFGLYIRRGLILCVFSLIVLVFSGHYLTKAWRRARPVLARPGAVPRVAYRACLDRLAEAGLVREEGETREAFARRLAPIVPAFGEITDMHVGAAFARPEKPDADTLRANALRWRRSLAALSEQLDERTSFWRRLLGAVDPTSLYRSR